MRQIKFRVWIKEKKKMLIAGELELMSRDNGDDYYSVSCYDPDDKYWSHYICPEGFVLMQFTGLLDKNGVEIYEGDVVRRSSETLDQCFNNEITYEGSSFCIRTQDLVSLKFSNQALDLYIPRDKPAGYDIEVIGNIYENPELLK
jgi:uncharacterized phage protein (TIGR01671 family)